MPKIITNCGPEVRDLCNEMLEKFHGDVAALKPKVGLYFIEYDSETIERFDKKADKMNRKGIVWAPPSVLKLHGIACAATIKQNAYKDRVEGKPDASITIDRQAWNSYSEDQQRALLDHELEHLVPKTRDGNYVVDDLGRPVFKLRGHDWDMSGFGSVVRRHGRAAIEVKTTVNFLTSGDGQMVMEFAGMKALPGDDDTVSLADLDKQKRRK